MVNPENNYAFIDEANLYAALKNLGWELDYLRFRIWLKEKYGISKAYLFMGFVPGKEQRYAELESIGYVLVHKEIIKDRNGKIKGNCDADLVLHAVVAYYEKQFDKAIVISSDGDFTVLVKFLKEKEAFLALISPSNQCSNLLRKQSVPLIYLDTQRSILETLKNQTPHPSECGGGEKAFDGDEIP